MERTRKKEKSTSQGLPPPFPRARELGRVKYARQPTLGEGLAFGFFIIIALTAAEIAAMFLLLSGNGKSRAESTNNSSRNLSFAPMVQQWITPPPPIQIEEKLFSVPEETMTYFPTYINPSQRTDTFSFSPPLTSLRSVVLKQLGTTNPWQAFTYGERVTAIKWAGPELYNWLQSQVATQIEQKTQDAELKIENGRAIEFKPQKTGKSLDSQALVSRLKQAMFRPSLAVAAKIVEPQPQITLGDLNDMGISELVMKGESDFHGSSASRIHNIKTGSLKFQGVIIKTGEEFSFNRYLGPVTKEAGFKPELVIKSNTTVPELGGGLCQVSTTVFRTALYGGLPITARRNHSYAVKYYAPQGTDATIYPGAVDLKFINDTSYPLIINTYMEGTKLFFEFYGTKDDRGVNIDGPYQYDRQPGGAMKARLSRVVTKNGQQTKDEFFSKYVSKDLFPTLYAYPVNPNPAPVPLEPTPTPTTPSNPAPSPLDQPANPNPTTNP